MHRTLGLFFVLLASSSFGVGSLDLEEGSYLLKGQDGASTFFSAQRIGDKWEIKSDDPASPLNAVKCLSSCDFLPMNTSLQEKSFPSFLTRRFVMSCVANGAFALCKMTDKPVPECGNPAVKIGEACRIGPQKQPSKSLHGLFALFAPATPPLTVTKVGEN